MIRETKLRIQKMSIYAYVGIAEAIFKLALVLFLVYVPASDNLIAYGLILALWSVCLQVFYRYYCYKKFKESHLSICRDKAIYKSMLSYGSWDLIGQFCGTGNTQGINILINIFNNGAEIFGAIVILKYLSGFAGQKQKKECAMLTHSF